MPETIVLSIIDGARHLGEGDVIECQWDDDPISEKAIVIENNGRRLVVIVKDPERPGRVDYGFLAYSSVRRIISKHGDCLSEPDSKVLTEAVKFADKVHEILGG